MNRAQRIGLSASFMYPNPKRRVYGPKTLSFLENDMAKYLTRENVYPVLIPDVGAEELETFTRDLDGIVLSGGLDVAPETYNELPVEKERWPGDANRDRYELGLLEAFNLLGKPVLGICRGIQLINIYYGGTVCQDIDMHKKDALKHRDAERYDRLKHSVEFEEGGLLNRLYGREGQVNSVHHQGIDRLGSDLSVEAMSPDGEIEAVSYKDLNSRWVVGVQWHPEFSHTLGSEVVDPDPLFQAFLEACSNQRQ